MYTYDVCLLRRVHCVVWFGLLLKTLIENEYLSMLLNLTSPVTTVVIVLCFTIKKADTGPI